MRRFSPVFFWSINNKKLLKSLAFLNGQKFRNAKNEYWTRAYAKIYAVLNITARIRKICRKYEGLWKNHANSCSLAHCVHRNVQANLGCPGSALSLYFPTKVAPREAESSPFSSQELILHCLNEICRKYVCFVVRMRASMVELSQQ